MKKALVVVALCALVFVLFVRAQSSGSGSFSGTVGGQPFSGTFTTSTTDPCSSSSVAKQSAPIGTGTQVLVPAVIGQAIYVCGFVYGTSPGGVGANKFAYGTAAQCVTNSGTPLTGNMQNGGFPAIVVGNSNQTILFVPTNNALCNDSGVQGFVTYVQR
jgi:hypothetical protein